MRITRILAAASFIVASFAGSASADIKYYDSSEDNGTVGDFWNTATNLCPPPLFGDCSTPDSVMGVGTFLFDNTNGITSGHLAMGCSWGRGRDAGVARRSSPGAHERVQRLRRFRNLPGHSGDQTL